MPPYNFPVRTQLVIGLALKSDYPLSREDRTPSPATRFALVGPSLVLAFRQLITRVETGYLVIAKASLTSRKLAKLVAKFAADKKAQDISILDMRKLVNFCDYFVICSGNTGRQVQAIADHMDEQLCALGLPVRYKQGLKNADWVVFDSGDVVIHIFQKDVRAFYGLEHLWQEAKTVK